MDLPRRALRLLILTVSVVVLALAAAAPALAADRLQDQRTLFLDERFRPGAMRAPLTSGPRPHELLAVAGEYEGFQLALRNSTSSTLSLSAVISGDAELSQVDGPVSARLLRIGFVGLPAGSSRLGTSAGMYADPLPELRPAAGAAGRLSIAPGQWGAIAVVYRVRTDATAGVRRGQVELRGSDGTTYARQPFSLDVRRLVTRTSRSASLVQPGDTPAAMKTVLLVEGDRYWLGHSAMRNGLSAGYPSAPDRGAQLQGLYRFYDEHGVAPLDWTLADPSESGAYGSCDGATLQQARYLHAERAIDPSATAFPARIVPQLTEGCRLDTTADDYHPTQDIAGTPGAEQDDVLRPTALTFWARVHASWATNGWYRPGSTYMLNPFDEPADATAAYRRTMNVQVPRATSQERRATRGNAKVFISTWPRDERRVRHCRAGRCSTFAQETYGNRAMWNGYGLDDPLVWMPSNMRLFGRPNTSQTLAYGFDRTTEYRRRLAAIKRLPGGREVWAYNFYTATRAMPQFTIDAPGTDSRLQYWILAREGHSGLFMSNSMLGWSTATRYIPGTRLRERGNPFEQATYFNHSKFGAAAGWGTFVYPAYEPSLGLVEERDRNTQFSRPTSSLRMEGMRDGQEDANLVLMYRQRFGSAMVNLRMRTVISDPKRALPATLGNVVYPSWSNAGLAARMEAQRRLMITQLSR
ncbi:MAG: hypothetical protein JWM86_2230 [Thermoleophilia bacterium]|nr:hypothetical protein [Thermoleophilia bacterium]